MKKKFAILTDIHFGARQNSEVFLANQVKYLHEEFIPELINRNINLLIIPGDVFDIQTSINVKVFNEAIKFFESLSNVSINTIVLLGNHDIYYRNTTEFNSIKFLKKFHNITLLENIFEDDGILYVPWLTDITKFIEILPKVKGKFPLCIGHFDIKGFPMYKGIPSESGLPDSLFYENFKITISGHFHTRTERINGLGNKIIYLGSPYQLRRNDKGEQRGFMMVTMDGDKIDHEFINNKNCIRFVDLVYPNEFTQDLIKGNVIDLFIDYADKFDETKLDAYIGKIMEFKPAMRPEIKIARKAEFNLSEELNKTNFASTVDLMNEYVEQQQNIDDKKSVKMELVSLFDEAKGAD